MRAARVPLALVGGPLMAGDLGLFDLIERCGGEVVLDATESGELSLPRPFERRRLEDDPIGELADAYFGSLPGVFRRPDAELFRWLRERLAERGARGMIVRHYIWCDLWHAAAGRLAEWGEVPVLNVQVDAEEHDSARLSGRIQAFVEMLR